MPNAAEFDAKLEGLREEIQTIDDHLKRNPNEAQDVRARHEQTKADKERELRDAEAKACEPIGEATTLGDILSLYKLACFVPASDQESKKTALEWQSYGLISAMFNQLHADLNRSGILGSAFLAHLPQPHVKDDESNRHRVPDFSSTELNAETGEPCRFRLFVEVKHPFELFWQGVTPEADQQIETQVVQGVQSTWIKQQLEFAAFAFSQYPHVHVLPLILTVGKKFHLIMFHNPGLEDEEFDASLDHHWPWRIKTRARALKEIQSSKTKALRTADGSDVFKLLPEDVQATRKKAFEGYQSFVRYTELVYLAEDMFVMVGEEIRLSAAFKHAIDISIKVLQPEELESTDLVSSMFTLRGVPGRASTMNSEKMRGIYSVMAYWIQNEAQNGLDRLLMRPLTPLPGTRPMQPSPAASSVNRPGSVTRHMSRETSRQNSPLPGVEEGGAVEEQGNTRGRRTASRSQAMEKTPVAGPSRSQQAQQAGGAKQAQGQGQPGPATRQTAQTGPSGTQPAVTEQGAAPTAKKGKRK